MSDASTLNDANPASAVPQQSATYKKYLSLHTKNAPLAGALLLCLDMNTAGAEWAMAATIAGAAFLGIDAQMQRLKLAQQNQACDFVVNSLDEALRILKNEIRKRQPIAVGLLGNAEEILQMLGERGVQPEFLIRSENQASTRAMQLLIQRGAQWLGAPAAPHEPVQWTVDDARDLPQIDALIATILPAEDSIRRRWLLHAPACFVRQRPSQRVLTLTAQEISAVVHAMELPEWRAQLRQPFTFSWADTSLRIQPLVVSPQS